MCGWPKGIRPKINNNSLEKRGSGPFHLYAASTGGAAALLTPPVIGTGSSIPTLEEEDEPKKEEDFVARSKRSPTRYTCRQETGRTSQHILLFVRRLSAVSYLPERRHRRPKSFWPSKEGNYLYCCRLDGNPGGKYLSLEVCHASSAWQLGASSDVTGKSDDVKTCTLPSIFGRHQKDNSWEGRLAFVPLEVDAGPFLEAFPSTKDVWASLSSSFFVFNVVLSASFTPKSQRERSNRSLREGKKKRQVLSISRLCVRTARANRKDTNDEPVGRMASLKRLLASSFANSLPSRAPPLSPTHLPVIAPCAV